MTSQTIKQIIKEEMKDMPVKEIMADVNRKHVRAARDLLEKQKKELRDDDRINTCDYSLLPKENRLRCDARGTALVRAYCEVCSTYKNEELGIGVD